MKITDEAVEAFTQYRRKQIAELRPWQPGDDMSGVSVSAEDAKAGSPKSGDMIARNPKNHADQWMVAAAYFAENFEPIATLPHLSQGAVRVKESDAERVSKVLGTGVNGQVIVAAMEEGDYGDSPCWLWRNHETNVSGFGRWTKEAGQAPYIRADIAIKGILSALSPAPVGVTDEMVEIVAKKVADFLGYAWEGLNSVSVVEQGYRMFTHGQFGWSFHGGQPDLRNVARDLLEAALASHEPAEARILELEADLEVANDKLEKMARVLREARGLLISLDGGRYIHNSRFPGQRIDGDLWDQVSRVVGKARAVFGGQSNG